MDEKCLRLGKMETKTRSYRTILNNNNMPPKGDNGKSIVSALFVELQLGVGLSCSTEEDACGTESSKVEKRFIIN